MRKESRSGGSQAGSPRQFRLALVKCPEPAGFQFQGAGDVKRIKRPGAQASAELSSQASAKLEC